MMSLYAHVADALGSTFEDQASKAQKELQTKALQIGWPRQAAEGILVEHGNGALHASGSHDAMLQEYGDAGQPPKSIIRTFNAQQHQSHSDLIDRALAAQLKHIL